MREKMAVSPRRFVSSLLLALAVVLTLSACAPAQPAASATATQPAYAAALQPLLTAKMNALHVPGAIIYVQDPGKGVWTTTLGTGDLSSKAPMSIDDHMRIGSITKTLTGTVILQLVDEGKLRLDDPVAKYQPQVPNGAHITIRQLLNMTSGLYNYSEDPTFDQTLIAEPHRVWQPSELLAVAFQHPPYFAPGAGFHYSNTNFILLGSIAEQITGKPLAESFQQRIFTPLGMTSTSLPPLSSAAIPDTHPQGYASQASGECSKMPLPGAQAAAVDNALCNVTTMNPSWGWAAGSAISTLPDLQRWAKALATGKLLSAATQRERLTWVDTGASTPTIKYGLAIFSFDGFLGHNGALPGFQSFMGYQPKTDATIITLTNLDQSPSGAGPADELAKTIIHQLFA